MLSKIDKQKINKKHVYLEEISNKEWRFVYVETLSDLMERFEEACEIMNEGGFEEASCIFRYIIKEVPEFIDAYNSLGLALMWSDKSKEGQSILEQGIEQALSLFPDNFFEERNRLEWIWLENRPFLRCYANLGLHYLENRHLIKAKSIFEIILSINPTDNQGVRDPLLKCYLLLGELDEGFSLCNQYNDDFLVGITYGLALVLFKQGKKIEAEEQFLSAMRFFPRVAKELIKEKHIRPKDYGMGPGVMVGGQEEAYEYWLSYGNLWKSTPGAVIFIKNCLAKFRKMKPSDQD